MQVFKHIKSFGDTARAYEIFKVVSSLKPYAITIYGNAWKDALDTAFFHIIDNYDDSIGDLVHYATKVVATIELQKYKKEFAEDDVLSTELDCQTAKMKLNTLEDSMFEDKLSKDFYACSQELASYFIKDFLFFKSGQSKNRKEVYTEIFKKYSVETIGAAREHLLSEYSEKVGKFLLMGDKMRFRVFSVDKIKCNYIDGSEYKGVINDIVVLKRKSGAHSKKIYRLNISEMVEMLWNEFYENERYGKIVIEGIPIYMTLSGNIVDSKRVLLRSIELELLSMVLSRSNLKILYGEEGKVVLFSSSKEIVFNIAVEAFGREFNINLERLVAKEVA